MATRTNVPSSVQSSRSPVVLSVLQEIVQLKLSGLLFQHGGRA